MSPRPDVSEERKSQIIDAAMTVFARLGFHEARMDDIAQEAGLSKAALYLYYKSKDAIIAAILKYFFSLELKKLRTLVEAESSEPISEQLLRMNQHFTADFQWFSAAAPVMFEFYAVAARQREVRSFLKDYFKDYRQVLARLIQQGIDREEFRPVNADEVAITIAALYEGLTLLWMLDPQAVQWEKEGEASIKLLLEGLKK
jgi:AcrR family transcriptional regulator